MSDDAIDPTAAEEFLNELASAHTQNYAEIDRYRDFRAVFLGSDQGRRVLYAIMGFGLMYRSSAYRGRFDPYKTLFHEGERNLALRILTTINNEPTEKPDRANSAKPEGE